MDQTYLLALAVAAIVALAALGVIRAKPQAGATTPNGADATFAVSTEGMKVCPKCGMGNLWTERRCSACGEALKG